MSKHENNLVQLVIMGMALSVLGGYLIHPGGAFLVLGLDLFAVGLFLLHHIAK